jgi:hypothetical protein
MGGAVSIRQQIGIAAALIAALASTTARGQATPAAQTCQQSNAEIDQDIALARAEIDSCRWRLEVMPSSCGDGFEEQPIVLACVTKLRDTEPTSPLTARAFDLLNANLSILHARVIWAKAEADVAHYRASGATDVSMVAARLREVVRDDIVKLPR